jgi:hypothetical protein
VIPVQTQANFLPNYQPVCAFPCAPQPAQWPRYVIPGSHWLDPPYSTVRRQYSSNPWAFGCWPYPRQPWAFESDTRAKGTGLLGSCTPTVVPPCPCPCPPFPMQPWFQGTGRPVVT